MDKALDRIFVKHQTRPQADTREACADIGTATDVETEKLNIAPPHAT